MDTVLQAFAQIVKPIGVLGVKITQNDELLAYETWDDECRRNVYSVSKSFTACAVGFAQSEGLLSPDEKLAEAFADSLPAPVGENLARATVRDLLTMCLGQESAQMMGEQRPLYRETDWVKLSLSFPFCYAPGSHFVYSNVGPYLAGVLVQKRAGCSLVDYLMPRLFAPLGIVRPSWETDPQGRSFGASGLMLTLSELHKFGTLCLKKGVWNDRPLLDGAWLAECTRPQSAAPYGYGFWMGEKHSFRADGKYGQLSVVFPEQNAVVSVVSECRKTDVLFRAIYDILWPALSQRA